jgi:predicted HTH domain antitoxin
MPVTMSMPQDIETHLFAEWGNLFERKTLEGLAAEGCRSEVLSVGEVARMLEMSINDADGFLKEREIYSYDTLADIDRGVRLEDLKFGGLAKV